MSESVSKIPVKKSRGRGRPAIDRELFYRYLWKTTDRRGIITRTQREVSADLNIGYQRVSEMYKDFVSTGHMKKHGSQFQVCHNPDHLDWGEKFLNAHDSLRKRHQNATQREKYDPSFKHKEE